MHAASRLVIDPNSTLQVVTASKKFNNILTYDFTLATEYSTDGGTSWHDSAALAMPGFTVMTDPTMAWDDSGNVFLVGLAGNNPPTWDSIGMVVYKSTDGGQTWGAPLMIHPAATTSSGRPATQIHRARITATFTQCGTRPTPAAFYSRAPPITARPGSALERVHHRSAAPSPPAPTIPRLMLPRTAQSTSSQSPAARSGCLCPRTGGIRSNRCRTQRLASRRSVRHCRRRAAFQSFRAAISAY